MRPAASCSVLRVASVTERTSDCQPHLHPPCPACQPVHSMEWATGGGGCTPNQNGLGQSLASFTRLTLPCACLILAAGGVDVVVLAYLCLLGPYSKTVLVCPDAQDPGVEGSKESKLRAACGYASQSSPGCGWGLQLTQGQWAIWRVTLYQGS